MGPAGRFTLSRTPGLSRCGALSGPRPGREDPRHRLPGDLRHLRRRHRRALRKYLAENGFGGSARDLRAEAGGGRDVLDECRAQVRGGRRADLIVVW